MLLHKTSWRIKHFIAQRKKYSLEDTGVTFDEKGLTERKQSTSTPRTLSWSSQTTAVEPLPPVVLLPRAKGTVMIRKKHSPPLNTNVSAHSSASSLCSYDCNTNPDSIEYSLSNDGPASKRFPNILYLPQLPEIDISGDAEERQLIFSDPLLRCQCSDSDSKTFSLLEALNLAPLDEDRALTQSIKSLEDPEMDSLSEDVDRLIRETDEAFKAVGTALADAKAATQGWHDTPANVSIKRSTTMRRSTSKKPLASPLKSPVPKPVAVPHWRRKTSVKKRKTTLPSSAIRKVPPQVVNTPTRWTLTDVTTNIVDVFSGKMFRQEVDEMLTPGRIQQIRDNKVEIDGKASIETTRSFERDGSTPTEPLHFESSSSRINTTKSSFSCLVPPPPAQPKAKLTIPVKVTSEDFFSQSSDKSETVMRINDLQFPSPPRLPRSRSNSRVAPILPTIPEVSPLTLSPIRPLNANYFPQQTLVYQSLTRNEIFFPSTPFTLTSPLFRHGSIRVPYVPLRRSRKVSNESVEEEVLDWTAFHMAIQGTMDEYSSSEDEADDEWEADETEIDDIIRWWEGFGLECGELAGDVLRRERVVSGSGVEHVQKKEKEYRKEVGYKKRGSGGALGWKGGMGGATIPEGREVDGLERGKGREKMIQFDFEFGSQSHSQSHSAPQSPPYPYFEQHETMDEVIEFNIPTAKNTHYRFQNETERRESVDSLPQSSMGRLAPSGDNQMDREGTGEVIPMGFNLKHDLGDFLNWEVRNVQSSPGDYMEYQD